MSMFQPVGNNQESKIPDSSAIDQRSTIKRRNQKKFSSFVKELKGLPRKPHIPFSLGFHLLAQQWGAQPDDAESALYEMLGGSQVSQFTKKLEGDTGAARTLTHITNALLGIPSGSLVAQLAEQRELLSKEARKPIDGQSVVFVSRLANLLSVVKTREKARSSGLDQRTFALGEGQVPEPNPQEITPGEIMAILPPGLLNRFTGTPADMDELYDRITAASLQQSDKKEQFDSLHSLLGKKVRKEFKEELAILVASMPSTATPSSSTSSSPSVNSTNLHPHTALNNPALNPASATALNPASATALNPASPVGHFPRL